MRFQFDDGGRAAAGFKGSASDCVTRAIAIATEIPYAEVNRAVNKIAGASVARTGVPKGATKAVMSHFGFAWNSTMSIGAGCTVHLRDGEIPEGILVVSLSRHVCAIRHGVIHDTHDPSRGGSRCVYGYWQLPS